MIVRRFNRYELKYVVTLAAAERIMRDLEEMTTPDEHGGRHGYPIVSLYCDSPDLEFFWAKIEGIKFRRKLRLRIYPGDDLMAVSSGMVEIKQRMNRTVSKRRLCLPLPEAEQLCEGASIERDDLDANDRAVMSEVQYLVQALHLVPTCITAYHRQAFVGGHYEPSLRVTFDTRVSSRAHGLAVNQPAANHLILPLDWCIMEVKVDEAVPDWVTSLLARHGCQLRRVSKYCTGLAVARNIRVMPLAIAPTPHLETEHG